jgi:hypothetical protein
MRWYRVPVIPCLPSAGRRSEEFLFSFDSRKRDPAAPAKFYKEDLE